MWETEHRTLRPPVEPVQLPLGAAWGSDEIDVLVKSSPDQLFMSVSDLSAFLIASLSSDEGSA